MLYQILTTRVDELVENKKRLIKLEEEIRRLEQDRIMSSGCNMLVKLFDKLENSCISNKKSKQSSSNDSTPTSHYATSIKYTRAAQNLDQTMFIAITNLSNNSFRISQSYPKASISNQSLNLFE